MLKNKRGITLIALVITIIVLLILAGVSIAMLTGKNGILTQANESKKKTELAEQEEKRELLEQEAYMEEYNFVDTELTEAEATSAGWNHNAGVITKYTGNETVVYVPTKIGNTNIEKIAGEAFLKNEKLEKVVSSVPNIYNTAFQECKNLNIVVLKEGTVEIGNQAFYKCENLEYVVLPDSLTTIKNQAFMQTAIKNIVIPKNVTSIFRDLFDQCRNPITIHCEIQLPEGKKVPEGWDLNWLGATPEGTTVDWGYTR